MAQKFFRKAALEKLSTPEKLDQMITVTSPRSWLVLGTLVLALFTGLVWSFKGTTKTKVNGAGIIMSGEVFNIISTTTGQILELKVGLDDEVQEGQVVALIDQPELRLQIQEAEARLREQELELSQFEAFGNEDIRVQEQVIAEQRISLQERVENNNSLIDFLNTQLKSEEELLSQGLITKPEVEKTRQQIVNLENENKSIRAKITQTNSQKLNLSFGQEQKLMTLQQRIDQANRRIGQLQEQLELNSKVISKYSGKVLEIMTEKGRVIAPGTPLFGIGSHWQDKDTKLRAVLFVPSGEGKKISIGMEALIAPSTIKPQEFGYMRGIVQHISDLPATPQGISNVLKNEQLVQQMLALGAPFEVQIEFVKNESDETTYLWTSREGPPVPVLPGTPCTGKVTVQQQTPIAIVLPALKEFFQLY